MARRAAGLAPVALALALGACGSATSSSSGTGTSAGHHGGSPGHHGGSPGHQGGGQSAPAKDTFSGAISSGTGVYSGRRGRVRIYLYPRGSGLARTVRAVILSAGCGGITGRCIQLDGEVRGTLDRAGHQLPDTGEGYVLAATGSVSAVGQVSATGSVAGTGFIMGGHEEMTLRLSSSSGALTISAQTGPVPGFHSP